MNGHNGLNSSFLRYQMVELILDHHMSWAVSLGCGWEGSEVGHSHVTVEASSQVARWW